MIKRMQDLTPAEKERFFDDTKKQIEARGMPWKVMEQRIQSFLDQAFDDNLFPKMSHDDQIDAAYCRKEFGKNKPSIIDYMLWSAKFVTHSDYVEISD